MADRYASLKQGLVGAWIPSISGSGLLLPDLSGRGNNGVLTNMDASDWVSGQYGRALDFDGSDDYVISAVSPNSYPFSISTWFKSSSVSATFRTIVGFGNESNTTNHIFLGLTSTNTLRYNPRTSFVLDALCDSSQTYNDGVWRNAIAVSKNAALHELYIAGVLVATSTTDIQSFPVVTRVGLGAVLRSSVSSYYDALIDDIRIYNRALTEPEIRLLSSEPGIGFKPAKKLSRFSQRFTYKPPKAKVFEGVRVRDHDYASLRQGLVGAWCPSLPNGGSGNTLPDQSGRGNHGTLTNMGPEDWVSGQYGRALDFDGSNDYVNCGTRNNALLVQSKAFSVSAWIYLTATTSDRAILTNAKITPNYDGMNFLSSAGKLRFDLGGDASPAFPLKRKETTSAVFSTGIWYHVAVTKPANAATSAISLYVNGVQPATTDAFNDTVADAVNNVNLQIAARDGANSLLQGQIDDLRLYSRALSEPEIRLLASRRGIGLQPSPTRFIAREKKTGLRRKILTGQT